jgi:hypothetical protein
MGTFCNRTGVAALESDAPAFRVTAFEHEGDWGAEGAWSGDVLPTVDTGLAAFGG